jgi:hypothetical protein
MKTRDRISFFDSVLTTFLLNAKEGGHICLAVVGRSDDYVQFKVRPDGIYGEVGSRQWSEPDHPLPPAAVDALRALGFVGGGPERNYARQGLPASASELATLADALLRSAYDLDEDYSPVLHELHLNDITLPRAEPFTRDMIANHLRGHGVHFLRDEDGDFRVDLELPDGQGQTVVWFIADGPEGGIYHVHGTAPAPSAPSDRQQALETCNRWNREHRWPQAWVVDNDSAGWRIVLGADIDLAPGITRALFDTYTERIITGMIEFWSSVPKGTAPATGDNVYRTRRSTDEA